MSRSKLWDKAYELGLKPSPLIHMPMLARLFKRERARRILDLGCGEGQHMLYLAKRGFEVYGVDLSSTAIERAKDLLKKNGVKARVIRCDAFKGLPFKSNFFNAIISFRTVNHGRKKEIERLFREANRVLIDNGMLFITIRKLPRHARKFVKFTDEEHYVPIGGKEKGIIHFKFTKEKLRKMLAHAGFRVNKLWVDRYGYYCLLAKKRS